MFIYHYHATKQLNAGSVTHIDGIVQLIQPVTTMDDYAGLKRLIAGISDGADIGGPEGMTVRSLTLLHETPNDPNSGAARGPIAGGPLE